MLVTVDTGGTKTLVASFRRDGTIAKSIRFPTPKSTSLYLKQLVETIRALHPQGSVDAIVIAVPGIVKHGVAVWCGNLGWRNFHIQEELSEHFPHTPVLVENDANLGGLGETRLLRSIPESVLYVTISTGIGTGVITDGKIDPGLRQSEGGHALVEFNGIVQQWESFAAGSAIYKAYGKYAKDIHSKRTWHQIADRISRGFLAIIPIIQPDKIIIGGSIGTYFSQYHDDLTGILKEKLPDHIQFPLITVAKHPEEAVIYGCYYYALDNLAHKKA